MLLKLGTKLVAEREVNDFFVISETMYQLYIQAKDEKQTKQTQEIKQAN